VPESWLRGLVVAVAVEQLTIDRTPLEQVWSTRMRGDHMTGTAGL